MTYSKSDGALSSEPLKSPYGAGAIHARPTALTVATVAHALFIT